MTDVWLVASGGYELNPLAVFDDEDAVLAWTDVWNPADLGRYDVPGGAR